MYELLLEVLHLLTDRIICDDSKVPLALNMNSCKVVTIDKFLWRHKGLTGCLMNNVIINE